MANPKADLNMQYELVEDMLNAIQQSTDLLNDSVETLKKIANKIDSGALKSKQGEQLSDTLRNQVSKRVKDANDNLSDLGKDLQQAMTEFRDADRGKS